MRKESFPRSSAGAQPDESRSERHGEPRLSIEEHCRTASICVAAIWPIFLGSKGVDAIEAISRLTFDSTDLCAGKICL
jgi:hypothetical protein